MQGGMAGSVFEPYQQTTSLTSQQIIGQGGPTNEQFADLWAAIAARYANNTKIIFGVWVLSFSADQYYVLTYCSSMNEPHDVPDIELWAETVQAAVTAIRNAG